MKTHVLMILAGSLFFSAAISQAAEMVSGRVDFVNLKNRELVVEDTEYFLAPNYTIKDRKGKVVSAFHLKQGRQVKFTYDGNRLVQELVIER